MVGVARVSGRQPGGGGHPGADPMRGQDRPAFWCCPPVNGTVAPPTCTTPPRSSSRPCRRDTQQANAIARLGHLYGVSAVVRGRTGRGRGRPRLGASPPSRVHSSPGWLFIRPDQGCRRRPAGGAAAPAPIAIARRMGGVGSKDLGLGGRDRLMFPERSVGGGVRCWGRWSHDETIGRARGPGDGHHDPGHGGRRLRGVAAEVRRCSGSALACIGRRPGSCCLARTRPCRDAAAAFRGRPDASSRGGLGHLDAALRARRQAGPGLILRNALVLVVAVPLGQVLAGSPAGAGVTHTRDAAGCRRGGLAANQVRHAQLAECAHDDPGRRLP